MVVNIPFDNGNGLVRGDQFSRLVFVKDLPAATYISTSRLTVKAALSDADGAATFAKAITTAANSDGQIEDNGATTGLARLRFDITTANTEAMTADTQYWWDVQVVLNNGDVFTLIKGKAVATEQVTKTNS